MDLRFLRTFVLFGDSSLDDFYEKMSLNIFLFEELAWSLFYEDEFIQSKSMAKYNMVHLTHCMVDEITSYLSLKNVGMMTEEKMFEYLFKHLHDLPKYCAKFLLPLMSDYKILRQLCRHLIDFYPILAANRTSIEYLYPRYLMTVQRITQFCLDLWTGKYKEYTDYGDDYDVSQCSSKITSLLIDIIPLELEVLYISTSKLMKESRSTELKGFVKQILKASPRILQNYLIHLQGRMETVAVNYAPTQSINVMIEFLLIFLIDIPKRFIHPDKLNDMLAHVGLLTRKISILMEESSENNINKEDFSDPDFLHLNDLLISNVCSVALIKKEIGMVKESLESLKSSFGKVRQTLDDTSGVVKDCWVRALDVAYEAEHVINSILVRDKSLSHLIFSLPRVTDKVKLILEEVTSIQLKDENRDDDLDAKSSHKTIELTVGHEEEATSLQLKDENGDDVLDAKFSDKTIELTVGHEEEVTSLQLKDENGDDVLDAKSSDKPIELTVGHEEEEAWIIDQLLDEHESELDVISIVGMPGLGKTTLANKVYKNALVASHFNVRAKCTVSQKYNKSNVLREILQQVTGSEVKDSEDDPADKLRRALLDKRYLIFLDDVWDIATGEMLIACFPKVKRGNRIILTSQSSEVGLKVECRSDPLHLQLLTPEKSWELFEKRVFGKGSCPAELSEVGHQIVDKCKGLPLAVVLITGVIVRGKEKDLWLKIQRNLDSFISANNNLQMMKVMQLSYDHLPCHLKPLLLYFARSQKSKRTPVSTLMQLWMAEGLVDHDSLEEVTQSYLDDLISSSLIMVEHSQSKSSWALSVMIKVCYVHDAVHDFCSVKAKKEKFFKLMNSGDPFHASDFLHRRLTIHTDDSQLHKKCVLFNSNKSSAGSKHLISLTVSGSLDNSKYIFHTRHLRLVRVLQLDDIVLEDSLIEEIGSLFHLRFLSIRANIKAIPMSWVNLRNLETLLIKTEYTSMVLVPRILKLSMLKHVTIDMSSFFEDEEDADNIRILEAENSKLTTLSQVDISYSEGTNDALAKFPNLQHLHCTIMVPKNLPTHGGWFPKFDVLNKLESLIAVYYNPWDYCGYPNEYHFPTSLKELRLFNIPVRPALLSAIAALPELEILEIIDSDFLENMWDASEDIYQSLKTLRLAFAKLSEWEVDRETFPKLEELILEYCFMLTEIPSAFGDIDTLKSIHVLQSRRDLGDSAIEIKKDVAAYTGEDKLEVVLTPSSDPYFRVSKLIAYQNDLLRL
ncbi:hypothetical protein R3W88_010829 [Solanum pinnatisectum]|uniref:Uncharacterized protein n=1 Tax=Solanum pinnatisectum TaxID=50273 RepID=A0AAV9L4G1_9SOLN|nr:hypothetical protein R3W88_010829 [Solanum pinnatisectum]